MSDLIVMGIFGTFAAVIGMVLGSFCNVAIYRLPEDRSLWWPRSQCPCCETQIRAVDNIPVFSYLVLGGRCRTCDCDIPKTYPLIESLGGLLGLLLFWRIFDGPADINLANWSAWGVYMGFITALIIASYVDLKHWIIPDETSIYLVPVGVACAYGLGWVGYDGPLLLSWRESLWTAAVFGGLMSTMAIVAHGLLGREGLGWGDVKLMGMIGAFVGIETWVVLLIGTFSGAVSGILHLIWTGRRSYLPLGPVLCMSAIVVVLFGQEIIDAWLPGMRLWQRALSPG